MECNLKLINIWWKGFEAFDGSTNSADLKQQLKLIRIQLQSELYSILKSKAMQNLISINARSLNLTRKTAKRWAALALDYTLK